MIAPIRFYQRFISPSLPASCRYYPTCSSYAVEALQVHGAFRGTWLAVRRLSRCHPWHQGGMDPVPPARERRARFGSSVSVNSVSSVCEHASERVQEPTTPDPTAPSAENHPDARPAAAEAPTPRSNAA
nr:membrane protein insertion efficiency factor YidD [Nakamurella panacisegetis]